MILASLPTVAKWHVQFLGLALERKRLTFPFSFYAGWYMGPQDVEVSVFNWAWQSNTAKGSWVPLYHGITLPALESYWERNKHLSSLSHCHLDRSQTFIWSNVGRFIFSLQKQRNCGSEKFMKDSPKTTQLVQAEPGSEGVWELSKFTLADVLLFGLEIRTTDPSSPACILGANIPGFGDGFKSSPHSLMLFVPCEFSMHRFWVLSQEVKDSLWTWVFPFLTWKWSPPSCRCCSKTFKVTYYQVQTSSPIFQVHHTVSRHVTHSFSSGIFISRLVLIHFP